MKNQIREGDVVTVVGEAPTARFRVVRISGEMARVISLAHPDWPWIGHPVYLLTVVKTQEAHVSKA